MFYKFILVLVEIVHCVTANAVQKETKHDGKFTINKQADFITELQKMADYHVNVTKLVYVCSEPTSLKYCSNVNYPIPKDLAMTPMFQEKMARASAELLKYLLNDTSVSYSHLKDIFCMKKFPLCNEIRGKMKWQSNKDTCQQLLQNVTRKSKDLLTKAGMCIENTESLDNYTKVINCVQLKRNENQTFCSHQSVVSPWLNSTLREITALLKYQYALNKNLTRTCRESLETYLCGFGLRCLLHENVNSYLEQSLAKCIRARTACKSSILSTGLTKLFLNCEDLKTHNAT